MSATREQIVLATFAHLERRDIDKLYVEDDGNVAIVITNDPTRGKPAREWVVAQATKKRGPASGSMGSGAGPEVSEGS